MAAPRGGIDVTRTASTSGSSDSGVAEVVRVIVAYSPDPACVGLPRVLGAEAIVVGREGTGLALPDARISRAHAALELRDRNPFVRDLGSRNGTFVNGERVTDAPLASEDVVRIGDHLLVVQELAGEDVWRVVQAPPKLEGMVGDGRAMRALRADVVRAASGDVAVLLLGETGTGKELVSAELHRLSGRRGAFVPVNCAAIPENLAEAELFGYVRGAFTGATSDSAGLFGAADGGTLLLDEIGEMPLHLQAKLLRALATGEVRRVGDTIARRTDVRVVAATYVELERAVGEHEFRADLLARLAGHVVRVPSLRDRRDDILALGAHFLAKVLEIRTDRGLLELVANSFSPDAAEALLLQPWPFNVRGLEQTIRSSASRVAESRIELAHLPPAFRTPIESRIASASPPATFAAPLIRMLEIRADAVPSADELRTVLEHFGGKVSRVAEFFGKERRQIYRWAERHAIDLDLARDDD